MPLGETLLHVGGGYDRLPHLELYTKTPRGIKISERYGNNGRNFDAYIRMPMTEGLELAQVCARAAADKKAENPVLLDLRGISSVTDFFFICTATSEPQLKAIASSIHEQLRNYYGIRPLSMDGSPASHWVVIDYGGVVAHIFLGVKREFYGIESLWRDAVRLEV